MAQDSALTKVLQEVEKSMKCIDECAQRNLKLGNAAISKLLESSISTMTAMNSALTDYQKGNMALAETINVLKAHNASLIKVANAVAEEEKLHVSSN